MLKQQDIIWYSAQEKCRSVDFNNEDDWNSLISITPQVREYVTLDGMLCPDFIFELKGNDWNYIVMNGEFLTDLYTDPIIFLSSGINLSKYNLLACIKEPKENDRLDLLDEFEFIGYDLIDKKTFVSALTNCGGFYDVYLPSDINEYGIFSNREFAYKIRDELFKKYPDEPHADCFVFELWRMKEDL